MQVAVLPFIGTPRINGTEFSKWQVAKVESLCQLNITFIHTSEFNLKGRIYVVDVAWTLEVWLRLLDDGLMPVPCRSSYRCISMFILWVRVNLVGRE